ncbi:trichohyalin-like [Gambusia affinis]|uniref:trichohyalin-like n=1 Tax=Gambusia affinis TaxID=33528 RepID=UPI001CDCCFCC|nr:trichohyalin-like [Gambusia affinis]
MSHHTPRYQRGTMGPQARRGGQENREGRFPPEHPDDLHEEIQRLSRLLEMERARRFEENQRLAHLEEELEEMKLQLERQTDVKETLISQADNAKMELERLERYSDPEIIKAVIIAAQAYKHVKDMNKKSLQQEYVDLKVAHLLSQKALLDEIHDEKGKSQALQEELDQLQTSYEELSSEYEGDDALLRQEAEKQTFNEEQLREEQRLLETLRAEKEDMFKEMSQKIAVLQESEKHLQEELIQLRHSYDELNYKYENEVSGLEEDLEIYQQKIQQEETALSREKKENLIHEINYTALLERVEKLNFQLVQDRKSQMKKSEEDKALLENLRAQNAVLQEDARKEIKFLQEREKLLHKELNQIRVSYNELNSKYERDVSGLTQDVERFQQEVKQEKEASLEREKENLLLIIQLRAEKEELSQKTSGEITILQKREEQMIHELDQVQVSYEDLKRRYERDVIDLQQQVATNQQQIKDHLEKSEEDKTLLGDLRAEYTILKENTTAQIKILQDQERSVQAELQKVKGLNLELNCQYKTEVTALKHQAEQDQQEIRCLRNNLERAREDLLQPNSLRDKEEDLHLKPIRVSQQMEEDSQNQVDPILNPQERQRSLQKPSWRSGPSRY